MRTRTAAFAFSIVGLFTVVGLTALRAPAQQKDVQLSEVAVRTLAAQTYLYVETETTFDQIGQTVVPVIERLEKLREEKKVSSGGSLIFVYHDAVMDLGKKFKLDVGFVVPEGTKAPDGGFKVRTLEPFKCATVLYGGPITSVASAYEKVMPAATGQGRKLTGESREYYLYWEGDQSVNNVEMIAVGIE